MHIIQLTYHAACVYLYAYILAFAYIDGGRSCLPGRRLARTDEEVLVPGAYSVAQGGGSPYAEYTGRQIWLVNYPPWHAAMNARQTKANEGSSVDRLF